MENRGEQKAKDIMGIDSQKFGKGVEVEEIREIEGE